MSDRMEMVSITRYSCLSGFHVAVWRAIESSVGMELIEPLFSFSVEVAITTLRCVVEAKKPNEGGIS
jgi:hypothetical protein